MADRTPRFVGVIDIGKTNAKVAVVDLESRREIAMRRTPNAVRRDGPYPHFDVEALWSFVTASLAELNGAHGFDALSVTTHGACAALVDEAGALALPVLDYEHAGPDACDADYALVRPEFRRAFTPALPGGLNLGKQLFWQARRHPEEFARTRWILPYPQYWAWRLSGVAASEITSLGCHTDLWDFSAWDFSALVAGQGWREKMPPLRPASDVLGPVRPDLAEALGLRPGLPVHAGLHDSNASLLPHVLGRTPPFSVVSTGTWVVVCSPGGDLAHLDPQRDTLANIDALGRPVPSARFMGGREFSQLTDGVPPAVEPAVIDRVLAEPILLLPSVTAGCGPFPQRQAEWRPAAAEGDAAVRYAAVSFYLALMTAECLVLTGAAGTSVVEGPFAANPLYCAMLEAATGRPVEAEGSSATGTSIGAALLARMAPQAERPAAPEVSAGLDPDRLRAYAARWRESIRS